MSVIVNFHYAVVQVQDGNNAEQIIFFVHGFKPLKLLNEKKLIQEYKNYLTNVGFDGRGHILLMESTGIPFAFSLAVSIITKTTGL